MRRWYTLYSVVAFNWIRSYLAASWTFQQCTMEWNRLYQFDESIRVYSGLCTQHYSAPPAPIWLRFFVRLLVNTVWGVLAIGTMYMANCAQRRGKKNQNRVDCNNIYSFAIVVSAEKWVRSCQRPKILSVWCISCGAEKLDSNLAIRARWARAHMRR